MGFSRCLCTIFSQKNISKMDEWEQVILKENKTVFDNQLFEEIFLSIFPFRKIFSVAVSVCVSICTILAFWEPAVNAFALISLAIPSLVWVYLAIKK